MHPQLTLPAGGDPAAALFKEWRHKLQKTFLGKTEAKAADMPDIDNLLKKIENYGEIPTVALTHSKIGKVMKHIVQLPAEKVRAVLLSGSGRCRGPLRIFMSRCAPRARPQSIFTNAISPARRNPATTSITSRSARRS